jgi:hypothetical protein
VHACIAHRACSHASRQPSTACSIFVDKTPASDQTIIWSCIHLNPSSSYTSYSFIIIKLM